MISRLIMIFAASLIGAVVNNCQQNGQKSPMEEGLKGRVLWVEGNQMPGPGRYLSPGTPVVREIHIFKPASPSQVKGQGSLFSDVTSEFVEKVMSDENGYFEIALPPGKYSVFVKEGDNFFASRMDNLHYNPVVIQKGAVSEMQITVNYKAYY